MEDFVIGVDLGGTNVRLAVVNLQGAMLDRMHCTVENIRNKEAVLRDLATSVQTLAQRRPSSERHLLAVGIGIAGVIRPEEGIVSQSPHLPEWIEFDARTPLEEALRVPLAIDNDANCFALGEYWWGAGRGTEHFCALTLGTGVGGGIILDGEIWRGADGMAGEIGHMIIEADGRPCDCGSRGCFEQYVSATAIKQFAVEALRDTGDSLLNKWTDNLEEFSAEDVYEAAKKGDRLALDVFRRMGYFLGIGLTNLINFFNVEMIVLGGKVSNAWELFIPETEKTIQDRAFKVPAGRAKVVQSLLGDNGGIMGAAYLALRKVGRVN